MIEDIGIRVHNALIDRGWVRLAHGFAVAWCRVWGHRRIIYGVSRDICIDCLSIVDEHPEGRR